MNYLFAVLSVVFLVLIVISYAIVAYNLKPFMSWRQAVISSACHVGVSVLIVAAMIFIGADWPAYINVQGAGL